MGEKEFGSYGLGFNNRGVSIKWEVEKSLHLVMYKNNLSLKTINFLQLILRKKIMYYKSLLNDDLWNFLAVYQREGINWGRLKNEWWRFHRENFKIWDGRFIKPIKKNYKISICIPCMNRLEEIKISIPENIEANSDYPNFELVLLDYNSTDGLKHWVKTKMMKYIESGLLVYYRTEEPKYFCPQHSRNLVMKLGSGDVVNMLDANKVATQNFAAHVNQIANQIERPVIFARAPKSYFRLFGRLGFFKEDFMHLGGFNEQLSGYGWQDRDLLYRAMKMGYTLGWYKGYLRRHKSQHGSNYFHPRNKKILFTHDINCLISYINLFSDRFIANEGKEWGKAKLVKNFEEEIKV
jgi:hypothetical protein